MHALNWIVEPRSGIAFHDVHLNLDYLSSREFKGCTSSRYSTKPAPNNLWSTFTPTMNEKDKKIKEKPAFIER